MPLPYENLGEISAQTLNIHHDKLYAGYVAKKEEIQKKLTEQAVALTDTANQTYSELRALKDSETFAVNGTTLHEWYFENLSAKTSQPETQTTEQINRAFGDVESFKKQFVACGMASRGWVVLAWDLRDEILRIYTGDAHNTGGVWAAMPVLVLDVYEHAYFIDFGSDRKKYIETFMNHINWPVVEQRMKRFTSN